jgi:hypothetical protein
MAQTPRDPESPTADQTAADVRRLVEQVTADARKEIAQLSADARKTIEQAAPILARSGERSPNKC